MTPFTTHRGRLATLNRANVDTDQIIPKQFLKSIQRTGFGEHLFHDWRYLEDGRPNPAFELNAPQVQGASILVTRHNFGCGSSREHAVWALQQYGFKAIIAPRSGTPLDDGVRGVAPRSGTPTEPGRTWWVAPRQRQGAATVPAFADIFRTNSAKNGLLPIALEEEAVEAIFQAVAQCPMLEGTVELESQRVTLHLPEARSFHFDIEPAVKASLLRGLDAIGLTLQHEHAIAAFEARHDPQWFGPGSRKAQAQI